MTNFGLLTAEIGSGVRGTPANFNRFRVLPLLLQRRPSPEATTLHNVWPSPGWYTMYTLSGALAPDGILPDAKFTLRPSLAFSYIASVTARHSTSSGRQPNFVAWYMEWNYGTFAEGATYVPLGGHHIEHWPTF